MADMSEEEKCKLVAKAILTPEGRKALVNAVPKDKLEGFGGGYNRINETLHESVSKLRILWRGITSGILYVLLWQ